MLEKVLSDIGSVGGIQASALVSNNGLIMVSDINSSHVNAKTIGAIVAMLTRSAVHTAKELFMGDIDYLLLNTHHGKIILIKVGSNAIFTVLADTNVDVSSTIKEMKRACEDIKNIFAQV